MHELEQARARSMKFRPSIESVLLGLVMVLMVQTFRANSHPFPWWVCVETLVQVLIPVIVFAGLVRRFPDAAVSSKSLKHLLQIGAFLFAGLPILIQLVSRTFFEVGDANEILALMVLQNAAWYLAILSSLWNFGRTAFLIASALVLFVSFTTNQWQVLALALFYSLIAMWWMMGHYWSRLETKLLDGNSKALRARWSILIVSILVVGGTGLIASSSGPLMKSISIAGFMPISGGQKWADSYANSGIGDGDMLVGGEDATTTGAVDSNQFIEDNRPSIYDAINEFFEGPVEFKKKKRNRAITISEKTTHLHNVKRSEQAGKTFRVFREKGKNRPKRQYEDIVSNALFYVEGSVPARFSVNTFNHFDGIDWTNRKIDFHERLELGIAVQNIGFKPWFVIQSQERRYLTTDRQHRIKIMRLQSEALPAAPFLDRWHIFKAASRDMFFWGDNGNIQFAGQLPPQTVIEMVGRVPNYHVLRSSNNFTNSFTADSNGILNWLDRKLGIVHHMHMSQGSQFQTERDSDSQYVQVANDQSEERLEDIADELTNGIEPGWNQVEAIVNHFRNEFSVDPTRVVPEDCDSAVDHFLDVGSGPSYLFATSAAQLLRAAGYKTRLATGFLVKEEDYIRKAGQSIVTSDHVHVWPEVCIDNCHWIPVEPTPGYPIPFNTETLTQFVKRKMAEAFFWVVGHPIASGFIFLLSILVFRFRAKLFAGLWWLRWYVVFNLFARSRLTITRRLLDARFRAAGFPRPPSQTIVRWFSQVDGNRNRMFYNYWLTDNFGSARLDLRSRSLVDACKELVNELPLAEIAKFANQSQMKKGES